MPRKAAKATEPAVMDFTTLKRRNRTYEWHEMPRAEDVEDGEPLRVKLLRLTQPELEAIPTGNEKISHVLQECRDYIVAWNLTAENTDGEVVPVPPPAELDEHVTAVVETLLTVDELQWIYQRLKFGHVLKVMEAKKASRPSSDTPESPNGHDSAAAS